MARCSRIRTRGEQPSPPLIERGNRTTLGSAKLRHRLAGHRVPIKPLLPNRRSFCSRYAWHRDSPSKGSKKSTSLNQPSIMVRRDAYAVDVVVDRGRRAYHFRSVAGLAVAESVVAGCRKSSCRLGPKKSQNFFGLSRQNSSVDVAFIASVMRWKCFRGVVPSSEPVVGRSRVRAQRVGERRPVTEKASTVPLLERSE